MGWFDRARHGYHRWAWSTGVRASRTENRFLLHAWIAVAIRRFLTEALKKEEDATAKKEREREKGRRKKSEVYRHRNGVSRDRTRGWVVIPDRLIYVYLKAYVCVCFYPCVLHHIDRFLAVCRRDYNARYRAQTVAFDTFPPRNWAPVTEFFIRKPRLDEPGTTSIYRYRIRNRGLMLKIAFTLWSSSRTRDTSRNIFYIRKRNGTA